MVWKDESFIVETCNDEMTKFHIRVDLSAANVIQLT
jgi:hypothetical protein